MARNGLGSYDPGYGLGVNNRNGGLPNGQKWSGKVFTETQGP